MVSFIRKRLQVFVSSTYTDLKHERQAAVEAILVAGHIPAGMELFAAGDESQMEVIKQWIDESDVYLLILGGRYGSIDPKTGNSYTELEYEYAASRSKALFACVINEPALEARVKRDGSQAIESSEPKKLRDFRAHVLTKTVRFWDDAKDIKIAVGETLSHFARREELAGWVRANGQADIPALADEIARLSKENALLRSQVSGEQAKERIQGLTVEELEGLLSEKNLLNSFIANRAALASSRGFGGYDDTEFDELTAFGLIQPSPVYGHFMLTDQGKTFLNVLELRRTRTKLS